jgi:hypothetical protein
VHILEGFLNIEFVDSREKGITASQFVLPRRLLFFQGLKSFVGRSHRTQKYYGLRVSRCETREIHSMSRWSSPDRQWCARLLRCDHKPCGKRVVSQRDIRAGRPVAALHICYNRASDKRLKCAEDRLREIESRGKGPYFIPIPRCRAGQRVLSANSVLPGPYYFALLIMSIGLAVVGIALSLSQGTGIPEVEVSA